MKITRAVMLAILATLTLLGSTATTADAGPGHRTAPLSDSESADPGDPGFPPGP